MALLPSVFKDWKCPAKYELRTSIGSGSYGSVAEAYDKDAKKMVAIKRCTRVFEDLIDCKRILREAAILGQLDHPTVVALYDVFVPEPYERFDEVYIVLEICDSDLKKLCRTPVFLSEIHILTIFHNLLCGLKYLKRLGIFHRDLKPANVLVNQDCAVKICDFGLARAMGIEQRHLEDLPVTPREGEEEKQPVAVAHTRKMKKVLTGHVVTRWYRAPELILLEHKYNEQIDMWSAGCILAELLGLMKENIEHPSERGPLFPGQSCFPLSPGNKSSKISRGNRDQLKIIFDIIGTPTEAEVALLANDAQAYVRKHFTSKPAGDLRKTFPGTSAATLELLKECLIFDPKKRMTVDQALAHPCLSAVQSTMGDGMADGTVTLGFEALQELNEKALRRSFLETMQKYHPAVKIPASLQ